MKCNNCGKEPDKIVWIKRMVHAYNFSQKMDEEYMKDGGTIMAEFGRLEFLKLVKNDIETNKNEGESFNCEDCFKERLK